MELFWQIERYGVEAVTGGGALDLKLLNTMSTLDNVYGFVQKLRGLRGEQIHTLTESERNILDMLYLEGML